jgi:adenine-specific DNA methylase
MIPYPKRLIEVDLPIKRISEHARREKSIRHSHISTLHIWWARRPLAACRAVVCASLWPDPADPLCPPEFREAAASTMRRFDEVSRDPVGGDPRDLADPDQLQRALLDFIAEFANWDRSTDQAYLDAARSLTRSAHEALGGLPGTRPLVVDPFAGGGAIPLEALRVGADAFASDLNPVAVLLNKVVLEYIPRYGQTLADEVRRWGGWIKEEAEKELAEFYPTDPDGAVPIAYLWARTVTCEGPGCGAEVPLIRSLWLAKKQNRSVALRMVPRMDERRVEFEILEDVKAWEVGEGTVRRGSATCPVCGYTTPVASVRKQLKARRGGTEDARLFCVVITRPGHKGRIFRLPTDVDLDVAKRASMELMRKKSTNNGPLSLVPDEMVNPNPHAINRLPMYGMIRWGDVFSPRQALTLSTLVQIICDADKQLKKDNDEFNEAVRTVLRLALSRFTDICNSLCMWETTKTQVRHVFTRQALPMLWDFAEPNFFAEAAGNFNVTLQTMLDVIKSETLSPIMSTGIAQQCTARSHPLPDDSANVFFTDPPYYDMINYADLSDFFYVWLRRTFINDNTNNWKSESTPKSEEIIVEPTPVDGVGIKDEKFYLDGMTQAFGEGRRILSPDGLGVVVFAHKSTSGWEALLQALMNAGWIITGSWPIDTELTNKVAGIGQARLMSSIHLVCRPRENPDGTLKEEVGDWRDVLAELPRRIHGWMPRLAEEGVVGADAIFSCIGPALEVFSRYSRVEKASGEAVALREYLVEVWAAVSREALNMIFEGADSTGFEEDARLTAMWLWTLSTGANGNGNGNGNGGENGGGKAVRGEYSLEYDAARKIAQGIGAHMETLPDLVEIKGSSARLLSVAERSGRLFGKGTSGRAEPRRAGKKRQSQASFEEGEMVVPVGEDGFGAGGGGSGGTAVQPVLAETVLDKVHQAMLLFAEGSSERLRSFLVEEVGGDQRFWRLAQALVALYPASTEERRWVEGVLARKKGLGL